MKLTYLATAVFLAMTVPAFATQCPGLMKQIDEAMATTTADDATKAQVMELYEKGKAAHEAGDHATSEADLGEALKLLGG
ncbi:hypothetical protein [Defluviimonas sp. SAOS-178_SWC]|uniref:hypothetical protein n=1 Tax=Defluviimonas sp. SAOS-178_SWC TaxID=3121287 RepID=UPI00322147A4